MKRSQLEKDFLAHVDAHADSSQPDTASKALPAVNDRPENGIAEAIEKVAEAFEQLRRSGLTERAIVLLLHDAIGHQHGVNAVTMKSVRLVLEAARRLPSLYLAPVAVRESR